MNVDEIRTAIAVALTNDDAAEFWNGSEAEHWDKLVREAMLYGVPSAVELAHQLATPECRDLYVIAAGPAMLEMCKRVRRILEDPESDQDLDRIALEIDLTDLIAQAERGKSAK